MGLDGTIRRLDGRPLGDLETVQRALAIAFPGVVLGLLPSGAEKIRLAAEEGVEFPDVLRQFLESSPAQHGGAYESADFSVDFMLGKSDEVQQVDIVLYGTTTAAEPMLQTLEVRFGWVTTHP